MSIKAVMTPRVSILMPAYDAVRYVGAALDDLLAQTLGDFELIVVDDASTDGTADLLAAYAARDSRIRLVRNQDNSGIAVTLNHGLSLCRAPLVARADADDRYPPGRLEKQVAFMDAHAEVGLLSCAVTKIDEAGRRLGTNAFPTRDGEIRLRELFVNCFSHPGVVFRTETVRALGGYDPRFEGCEDAELWSRLRAETQAANLPEALVLYRKHGASAVQTRRPDVARRSTEIRRRLQADYLGRAVSLDEARSMQDTIWVRRSAFVDGERLNGALEGLEEVLDRARQREAPRTVRSFRDQVARALIGQAILFERPARTRLNLLRRAATWSPGAVARHAPATVRRRMALGASS